MALTQAELALLRDIVSATESQAGFLYCTHSNELTELISQELVESNPELVTDAGIAHRATLKGILALDPADGQEAAPAAPADDIEIETGIAVPKIKRRGRAGSMYPFHKLNPGDSFHIAPTEEKPTPHKSLASTVSSQNRMHQHPDPSGALTDKGKPVMVATKKFIVREVDETDPKGAGARVFRTV